MDNNYFSDVLFPSDWLQLSHDVLKKLPPNPWDAPPKLSELDEAVRTVVVNTILAGRGSISWFALGDKGVETVNSIVEKLKSRGLYSGYSRAENRPAVVRAGHFDRVRHIWRIEVDTGVRPRANGTAVAEEHAVRLVTVVVDLGARYVEIRAGNTLKKPILRFLTDDMNLQLTEATNFRAFEGELDGLATTLGATVIEAHSIIALDQRLDEGIYDKLGRIIEALDNAIANDDPGLGELDIAISEYKQDPSRQPLMLVLLNGLGAVGMEISRLKEAGDLRTQPFYRFLKPLAEHAHGFLRVPFDGHTHTIRIGFTTNTLEFRTEADEKFVTFVRERVSTAE